MTDMVERVARAIHAHIAQNTVAVSPDYKHDRAGFYEGLARAAIDAMREPTEEMELAWIKAAINSVNKDYPGDYITVAWQAMFNAALEEK